MVINHRFLGKIYTIDMNHPMVDMFGTTATVTSRLAINMQLIQDQAVPQWTYVLQGVCYIDPSVSVQATDPLLDPSSIACQHIAPGCCWVDIHTLQLTNTDVWPLALTEHLVKVYGQFQMERDIGMDFIWSIVDWEPPASTNPTYTVSSSGTVEYLFIIKKQLDCGEIWLKGQLHSKCEFYR